ncbi:FMRFamide receptor isoform X2 [Ischnura elegans]|uniref:FMRFamide receptor isoform X2 n=1 Tax=Ischnura elegans TaxID=197161 RepID=UPI001ED87127|nr:FMRFamide receptor isoform X2 [Ischnura elegans]
MESEDILSTVMTDPANLTTTEIPVVYDEVKPYEDFLDGSRFWIQRVIVPIVVFIGFLGNVATMAVLTRRRMRSSTNVYLTALAASDLLYLVFMFTMSMTHYPKFPPPFHEIYWRYYPFGIWLTDATSSTSVWLTVSFTVERYIAVCHPMKGKVLCTEKRARRVTALVYALCFLTTMSTPFEYEGKMVPVNPPAAIATTDAEAATTLPTIAPGALTTEPGTERVGPPDPGIDADEYGSNKTEYLVDLWRNGSIPTTPLHADVDMEYNLDHSPLAKNETYRTIFYWFTCVSFVFLPLVLLFVFNSFLIHAVHTSRRTRRRMTLVRKAGEQSEASQTQENKITITLIAVVILFVVCQLPTALLLIYQTIAPEPSPVQRTLLRILGNFFNLLVAINAASNFLLYCALSGKYRRTFVRTFAPCWAKSWRYMASTRRRTSIRESVHEGGALMRKRGGRRRANSGNRRPRERKESTESYNNMATSSVDDSQCRGTEGTQKSPSGGPDLLSVPTDDRNGGSQSRLKRHSSAYVASENKVSQVAAGFFRTRSMGSRGKKPNNNAATSSMTSSSSTPLASGSIGTPSSSITREDSTPLVCEGGKTSRDEFLSPGTGRNGSAAANGRNGMAKLRRTGGFLSSLQNLNKRLWRRGDQGVLTSSSAVVITVTEEDRKGERKGV